MRRRIISSAESIGGTTFQMTVTSQTLPTSEQPLFLSAALKNTLVATSAAHFSAFRIILCYYSCVAGSMNYTHTITVCLSSASINPLL
jgi:hypothetical protein